MHVLCVCCAVTSPNAAPFIVVLCVQLAWMEPEQFSVILHDSIDEKHLSSGDEVDSFCDDWNFGVDVIRDGLDGLKALRMEVNELLRLLQGQHLVLSLRSTKIETIEATPNLFIPLLRS